MNRKDRTILSKIKTSYVVAMIELMVLTGICFGLTTGKLQIARGQQYHGVGMICLILLDVMIVIGCIYSCLLYTSPSPRDRTRSRMPSSA